MKKISIDRPLSKYKIVEVDMDRLKEKHKKQCIDILSKQEEEIEYTYDKATRKYVAHCIFVPQSAPTEVDDEDDGPAEEEDDYITKRYKVLDKYRDKCRVVDVMDRKFIPRQKTLSYVRQEVGKLFNRITHDMIRSGNTYETVYEYVFEVGGKSHQYMIDLLVSIDAYGEEEDVGTVVDILRGVYGMTYVMYMMYVRYVYVMCSNMKDAHRVYIHKILMCDIVRIVCMYDDVYCDDIDMCIDGCVRGRVSYDHMIHTLAHVLYEGDVHVLQRIKTLHRDVVERKIDGVDVGRVVKMVG